MKVVIYGALWAQNFGDILLAKITYEQLVRAGCSAKFGGKVDGLANEFAFQKATLSDLWFADKVVFCGGGYLSEPKANKGRWFLSRLRLIFVYFLLASLLKKQIVFYGVGAGPVNTIWMKTLLKIIVKRSKKIFVRDKYGFELLKKASTKKNVFHGFDLAYFEASKSQTENNVDLLIHLTSKTPYENDLILDFINTKNFTNVIFVEDHPGEYERIVKSNPKILTCMMTVHRYQSVDYLLNLIQQSENIITTKLHVGILGVCFCKNVISIPYHPKVVNFYKEIGAEWRCIQIDELTEKLPELLTKMINQKPTKIPDSVVSRFKKQNTEFLDAITE